MVFQGPLGKFWIQIFLPNPILPLLSSLKILNMIYFYIYDPYLPCHKYWYNNLLYGTGYFDDIILKGRWVLVSKLNFNLLKKSGWVFHLDK